MLTTHRRTPHRTARSQLITALGQACRRRGRQQVSRRCATTHQRACEVCRACGQAAHRFRLLDGQMAAIQARPRPTTNNCITLGKGDIGAGARRGENRPPSGVTSVGKHPKEVRPVAVRPSPRRPRQLEVHKNLIIRSFPPQSPAPAGNRSKPDGKRLSLMFGAACALEVGKAGGRC